MFIPSVISRPPALSRGILSFHITFYQLEGIFIPFIVEVSPRIIISLFNLFRVCILKPRILPTGLHFHLLFLEMLIHYSVRKCTIFSQKFTQLFFTNQAATQRNILIHEHPDTADPVTADPDTEDTDTAYHLLHIVLFCSAFHQLAACRTFY